MMKLSILYVGPTNTGGTCLHRRDAFIRIGCNVTTINTFERNFYRNILYRLSRRLGVYIDTVGANQKILHHTDSGLDLIWIDKGLIIQKHTLTQAKKLFPKVKIVSYSPDDMMNLDNQSRQYRESISLYDLHVTTKSYNVRELRALGAEEVFFVNNAFDPVSHKPEERKYRFDVGFIGTYENERAKVLLMLADAGFTISVWGNWPKFWRNKLRSVGINVHSGEVLGNDYARAVSHCKINLCFLRKVNRDLQTTRSIEIPAMRGFMLAERSTEHLSLFVEDVEAVFFSSEVELVEKAREFLSNDGLRESIAEKGYERCIKSNYSNDEMLKKCLRYIYKE